MSKAIFSVVVIRKGRESDYYDFWSKNIMKNAEGEDLHSDLVGFTESVVAKNKNEAIALVRAKHPGLQIDVDATQRHT